MAEDDADAMGDPSEEPGVSKQTFALRRLREALLALWLPRPSALSFRVAIHHVEREGEFLHHGYEVGRAFIALDRYRGARVVRGDLDAARQLFATIAVLPHEGPLWIACRSLFGAIQDTDPPLRFLLLWIALEALFCRVEQSRGIGDVLCGWAGAFLEVEGQSRRVIRKLLRKSYDDRHAVVHGMRLRGVDPEALVLPAEGAARGALHKILSDPDLVATFNGSGREAFLGGL